MANTIVQYVIVRGDLIRTLNWPVGAVLAQACHAVTAAIHLFYKDEIVQTYLSDLDNMHKIVLEVINFRRSSVRFKPVCSHHVFAFHFFHKRVFNMGCVELRRTLS